MMTKRMIAMVMTAVMFFGLAACGSSETGGTAEAAPAASEESSTVEISNEPAHTEEAVEEQGEAETETAEIVECELEDGVYTAKFDTDSSMFHVNEACEGRGELTVENGIMTIHVSLVSKNILNLFPGLAEDAEKDGAVLLEPTTDTVTYSDGMSEEVYGFDIPVPFLDEEFDLALIGKKGSWYDHKVSVSDVVPVN